MTEGKGYTYCRPWYQNYASEVYDTAFTQSYDAKFTPSYNTALTQGLKGEVYTYWHSGCYN